MFGAYKNALEELFYEKKVGCAALHRVAIASAMGWNNVPKLIGIIGKVRASMGAGR